MKSPWSRLRKRLNEVTGRVGVRSNRRVKFGSLIKLADDERSKNRFSSQVLQIPEGDGVTGLWQEIHRLEDRVQVLENTLELSRDIIAKTEEKYDNLHKKVELLLETQLRHRPLDAEERSDGDPYKAQMSQCFEQIRNQQYQLKHVAIGSFLAGTAQGAEASRNRRKCAGCGKSAF